MSKIEYYEHCIQEYHTLYEGHYSSVEAFKDALSKSDIRGYIYRCLKNGSRIAENGIIAKDLSDTEVASLQLVIEINDDGDITLRLPTLIVDVFRIVNVREVAIPGQAYQPARTDRVLLESRQIMWEESAWNGGRLEKVSIDLDEPPE